MPKVVKSIRIKFDKLYHETGGAYLVLFMGKEHWLPKKMCQNFITNKKLGGNTVIPSWLYEKITGETVSEPEQLTYGETTWVVEQHIPDKIVPIEDNTIADLKV